MSLNDRAAEAAAAIRDGADYQHDAVRAMLLDILDDATAGIAFPGGLRDACTAICAPIHTHDPDRWERILTAAYSDDEPTVAKPEGMQ